MKIVIIFLVTLFIVAALALNTIVLKSKKSKTNPRKYKIQYEDLTPFQKRYVLSKIKEKQRKEKV
jgi:hypothetical protein